MKNTTSDADCIFEKKKWISITGLCNNNCKFCLDKERPDKFHKHTDQIKKEIKQSRKEGNTKLVLSGGDPTIHPQVVNFVKYAKKQGYKKVQLITNGRRFASKKFCDEIIKAGLDEVTFSIHGHNSETHDSLTRVPGSFNQTLKGVVNVNTNPKNIIINTDTCITKSNYKDLPKIMRFIVEKAGIHEVNLMSMVPQGGAWKNRKEIMYDHGTVAPQIHKVIDYCKKKGVVLWLSRVPPQYLEGNEEYISDAYKMVDDIRGLAESTFENSKLPPCKGEKCNYCGVSLICKDIILIKEQLIKKNFSKPRETKNNFIVINRKNLTNLPDSEDITLKYPSPKRKLADCTELIGFDELKPILKKIKKSKFKDIPPCIVDKKRIVTNGPEIKREYIQKGKIDYIKIAEDLSLKLKIKRNSCKLCQYFDGCEGIYQKYIRLFGFDKIRPKINNKEN